MKKQLKKITIAILCVSISTFAFSGTSFAKTESHQPLPPSNIDSVSVATKHKILTEKNHQVATEAIGLAAETQKAITALHHNDIKIALSILQSVSSKLDGILAKNPGLALVPISFENDVFDFEGSNKEVEKAIDEAQLLLKTGKLQQARGLLSNMASEIRITATSIPLKTFPAAIKQAIPLIEAGNTDQAIVNLNNELNTLVMTTEIIPLPVFQAEALLTAAAELEHKDDLTKEKSRVEIQKYTDAAKDKLKLAELLGYGDKNDYKILYTEIDAIDKTLFSEKSASQWQQVKTKLSEFAEKIIHPTK